MSAGTIHRATLAAGGTSTEYLRAGRGGTVLLLGGGDDGQAEPLVGALARGHRVIAPLGLPATRDAAAALTAFIECLGVASLAIVAEGAHGAAAVELAAAAPGTITHVVLLGDVDAAVLHGTTIPVLVERDPAADVDALAARVGAFIG